MEENQVMQNQDQCCFDGWISDANVYWLNQKIKLCILHWIHNYLNQNKMSGKHNDNLDFHSKVNQIMNKLMENEDALFGGTHALEIDKNMTEANNEELYSKFPISNIFKGLKNNDSKTLISN